jgi:glycosyltransferase involved in cell wall biosynthesis
MKLIIQIPCLNEEETLPGTLADLPRRLDGFDTVEWLIIDDGSTDRTVEVARAHGVDHIVRLTNNKGLAAGFQAGLDACLKLGADVIVNTDADNQYNAGRHPQARPPDPRGPRRHGGRRSRHGRDRALLGHEEAPAEGRLLGRAPGLRHRRPRHDVGLPRLQPRGGHPDGGRLEVHVHAETIIQAGKLLVATDHVRVGTNPQTRESRLFPSVSSYVRRNALSILRIYAQYEPLKVFFSLAAVVALVGAVAWGRFFIAFVSGDGAGHVQSLIFGAVLFNAAVVLAALGVIGDLLYGQRIMVQRIFERVRRIELALDVPPVALRARRSARRARPATTGAQAGPHTEEREAVQA